MGLPPTQKLFASARPPTASELNYNFYALWNVLNGYIDAANAPTLLSKLTGGDIQAALRIINNGIVIGAATSPAGAAGRFLLDDPAGIFELATQGGAGAVQLKFSQTAGTLVWQIAFDTTSNQLQIYPSLVGTDFVVGAPLRLGGTGQVNKTVTIPVGTGIIAGANGEAVIQIPNDAKRAGGLFKLRAFVNPVGAGAAAALHYHYNWRKSSDAWGFGAATDWAPFTPAATTIYVTEWSPLAVAPAVPAAGDQFLVIQFNNATAVTLNNVTLELQYKIDRHGLNADAT